MEFKGTKGEWKVVKASIENRDYLAVSIPYTKKDKPPYRLVCEVSPLDAVDNEDKENAKLIAAAPELLEACQELVSIIKIAQNSLQNNFAWAELEVAEKAIEKALK